MHCLFLLVSVCIASLSYFEGNAYLLFRGIISDTCLCNQQTITNDYHHNATIVIIDVMQSEDTPNKFFFYEVYEDAAAIAHHKEQPHYAAWGAFKDSGGTISSVSKKASGKFLT